jgi:hypothetical protein
MIKKIKTFSFSFFLLPNRTQMWVILFFLLLVLLLLYFCFQLEHILIEFFSHIISKLIIYALFKFFISIQKREKKIISIFIYDIKVYCKMLSVFIFLTILLIIIYGFSLAPYSFFKKVDLWHFHQTYFKLSIFLIYFLKKLFMKNNF